MTKCFRYFFVARALVLAVALGVSGCMSGVTVTKVRPGRNPKGLRVHLPAPFLVGRRNATGQMDWKIEFLPDPDEEYAIRAWAFLAKNDAEFARTRSGMLTKAMLDLDTATVAAQLAKSSGAVGSAAFQAANEQRVAAEKEAKAALEKSEKAEAEREKDVGNKTTTYLESVYAVERARKDLERINETIAGLEAQIAKAQRDPKDPDLEAAARTKLDAALKERAKARLALEDAEFEKSLAESVLERVKASRLETVKAGKGPAEVELHIRGVMSA